MASTDAKPIPQKNVAYRVTFPILDADGDLVTGATGLDSEISKDGGTFADCTNEATEIATSSGMYYLDLTSTEMNADTVAIIVKTTSSGAKTTPIVMYPEEAGDIRVNATQWNSLTTVALPLVPTTAGRTLDVSTGGEAGIDWANIGSPTTAVNLSATNIDVDQVVASVSGAVGSVTGAVGSVTGLTNATIADAVWDEDATAHQTQGTFGQAIGDPVADTNTIYKAVVTDAAGATVGIDVVAVKAETASIQTDTNDLQTQIGVAGAGLTAIDLPDQTMNITGNITGNLSGSVGSVTGAVGSVTGAVGSVTGAVGSVTGDVGGNVVGTVASVVGAVGSVTGNVGGNVVGSVASATIVNGLAANVITAASMAADASAEIADAVWDEAIAGHLSAGSTGEALNAAGAAGDPWTTTLPGAYGAGSAGFIIGTNIDAPISTVDTVVDAIKVKTDSLTFTVANKVDSNVKCVTDITVTGTGTGVDPWGP